MGDKLYEENSVQAIAESIRSKLGVDTTYKIAEMSGAINTIVVPDGTTNITENGYHDVAAYEQAYVHVEGGITPTGTTNIYENGDYDVTDYAIAHVAVPQPIGKKTVTENGTDIDIAQYATLDVNVQPNLGTKTVNQNGVYNASDDSLDGYSKVTVNTPVPTGKKTIAANGTDIDVSSYALVDVAVPGPVGKKVITENGTNIDIAAYATADVQVPGPDLGTKTITENGTYNASSDNLDGYSQVTVNVEGFIPSGTLDIIANATGIDVSQYAYANVNVPPEYDFRDKTIIPDKYNTGCRGHLTPFDLEHDDSGLHYNTPSGALELKFNTQYSSTIRDVDTSKGPIIYKNIDFTGYTQFQFMSCNGCNKTDANYTPGVVIIFENCLFKKVYANSTFLTADMIQFAFFNCTMEYFNISNSIVYGCKIGNKTFYKNKYGDEVLEDAIGVNSFSTIANTYVMDVEPRVSAAGGAHFDGLQANKEHDYYNLYNVRFECMNMPYDPKGGGWTSAVNFEHAATHLYMAYCIIHGGGYYQCSIKKGENQTVINNYIEGSYSSACYPSEQVYQLSDGFAELYSNLYVSSCFADNADITIVCTNDTTTAKTLTVIGYNTAQNTSTTYTFNIPACPSRDSGWTGIDEWDDLPFDIPCKLENAYISGIDKIECYDGTTKLRTWYVSKGVPIPDIDATKTINLNGSYDVTNYSYADVNVPQGVFPTGTLYINENGTYNVSQYANANVDILQYDKPVVPQTGTWQYKSTYQKGFIILGKDDDPADSAQFVRMINGYGFPVVLNSSQQWQNNIINSDDDTQYSTYPSYSYSMFPNGGTINQLNKLVIAQNRGEIAMHGGGEEKIWDSTNLTGTTLDNYYSTYTTGGGTKTKEEFKSAIMEKYASTDVAQGASILDTKRKALQNLLGHWVYSIGLWGGNFDFIIDDINCGTNGAVASSSIKVDIQKNFMGDGTLSAGTYRADPYYIYRDSSGLTPSKIETDILAAYNARTCIELFHHYYLDGTASKWNDFKASLDTLKNYVSQGKVSVVTRKEFYDLGEFVEHPITSISISPNELTYPLNTEFSASDFIITANLNDGTTTTCQADRILDLSHIDSTTEGTYTVYLEYRGFFANCSVSISNVVPTHYLLENYSTSGDSIDRLANFGVVDPALAYESGKSYRIQFHFRAETTAQYSSHNILFNAPTYNNAVNWRSSTDVYIDSVNGITEADITIDITVNASRDIGYLARCGNALNTTIGSWTVTNGYVYEITQEGGD